jgi:hypothetical protein
MMKKMLFVLLIVGIAPLSAEHSKPLKELPKENREPWKIKGDFFCWNTYESGLEYVYDDVAPLRENFLLTEEMKMGKFYWRGGFRVSVGYTFEPDQWQFEVQYGNYDPWHKEMHMRHEGRFFQGIFPQFPLDHIDKAESYLSLRTHFADLYLKRKFATTPYLHLTLINAFSAIWFRQRWEVDYFDGLAKTANRLNIKNDWNFKGGGPKIGLDMDWLMKWGLGIHTAFCGAAFFGNYDNRVNIRSYPNVGAWTYIVHAHLDDFRITTQLQFVIGPSWEHQFKRWKLNLFAGFEINTFFNLHEVDRQFVYDSSDPQTPTSNFFSGHLHMQGLTTSLALQF